MPADLPTLQGRLDALKKALANGVKSVSYADRRVDYRDVAEIRQAIVDVEADMAALNNVRVTRTFRFYTGKGL